jgi:hypothetical protein
MILDVTNISYELNNSGLNLLLFEHKTGYFKISRLKRDELLYVELNNPSNGKYIHPDCYELTCFNKEISFYVSENRTWELGIYQNISLLFNPVNIEKFKEIGKVIDGIFF